jgi:putative nucleotidyltransferase with HDIG domain
VVEGARTVDFTGLAGTLEDDLRRRDFTLNAVAVRIPDGEVEDPTGGLADLAVGAVRPVSDHVFADDPLRLLRLPRIAAELELDVSEEAASLAARDAWRATQAAPERQLAEIGRILAVRDPANALELADRLGVLGVVLPEVTRLHGVEQNPYHHLDVFDHTLHVIDSTADVAGDVAHYFPASAVESLDRDLSRPVDATLDQRAALRWAALFHDVAKPQTRTVTADGGVKFFGHDVQGARIARDVLARLHASQALRRFCEVLIREHLRLGFLIRQRPLDGRLVHRYATATRPYVHASIVLSLGDRFATRGERTRLRGLRRHHALAQELAVAYAAYEATPLEPVIRGDNLARLLDLRPGPVLGELLSAIEEEQAAGEVRTPEDAVRFGRGWLSARGS